MTEVRRRVAITAGAFAAVTVGVACATPLTDSSPGQSADVPSSTTAVLPADVGHVHALARDPESGALLLASHRGLYRSDHGSFVAVGPVMDLMGFTVTGPGTYLASGHPQPGSTLPEPAGLIESRDAGRTWQVLSRAGQSDFHVLGSTNGGIVAFDDMWRTSSDGFTWTEGEASFAPISLATSPSDTNAIASDDQSLWTSSDGGHSWTPLPRSPGPALLVRTEDAVVAVTADGTVHLGQPAGTAWKTTRLRAPGPLAVTAWGSRDALTVVVLADLGLVVSRDGQSFEPWAPDGAA